VEDSEAAARCYGGRVAVCDTSGTSERQRGVEGSQAAMQQLSANRALRAYRESDRYCGFCSAHANPHWIG
jgi:hypothetical protein